MPGPATPDLEIATPERVALSLPVAGIGYRSIAYLVDLTLLFSFWTVAYFLLSLVVADILTLVNSLSSVTKVIAIVGWFASQWLYWTVSEVFWNGQTPGKRLLRIRVVREDGGPAGFFESAVRNLVRLIDFLPVFYAAGLITMLSTRQHRRLGDLLAGTLLVREETFDLDRYRGVPAAQAQAVAPAAALPALSTAETELVLEFLTRRDTLAAEARKRLGLKLLARFASDLTEPDRASLGASEAATEAFLARRAQSRA